MRATDKWSRKVACPQRLYTASKRTPQDVAVELSESPQRPGHDIPVGASSKRLTTWTSPISKPTYRLLLDRSRSHSTGRASLVKKSLRRMWLALISCVI